MTPLPVLQLHASTDAFRCVPYAAVITAGSCVIRQANARRQFKKNSSSVSELNKSHCTDCALGRQVAAQLADAPTDVPAPMPSIETPKPEAPARPVTTPQETTMAKCKWTDCAIEPHKRGVPGMEALDAFCSKHQHKIRASYKVRRVLGIDDAVAYPSMRSGGSRVGKKPATPAKQKPAKAAKQAPTDAAIKPAKQPRAPRAPAVAAPASFSIRMASIEIEGEAVSVEQLAGLWRAVRGVLGE